MDATERKTVIDRLSQAFGGAIDVTPAEGQPLHALLPQLALPEPWGPSPTRALTVWQGWPSQRPRFVIDERVVDADGQPPRSNNTVLLAGESWREFSFAFAWQGNDPARAIQLWMTRFIGKHD